MAGSRSQIEQAQWRKLELLLRDVAASNPFYKAKLRGVDAGRFTSVHDFRGAVPLTVKDELVEDQSNNPPYGTNLTFPLSHYTRLHQTSGTTGKPLRWLDTPDSWSNLLDCWQQVFEAAEITRQDRVFFTFSFGPFIGFWMAFEAAERLGCLCIPGGGLNSVARLRVMLENQVTALCCTPTYALRLTEVAHQEGIDLSQSPLRRIIVAGEPGGSIPTTRRRLESAWKQARVFDHHGMTEVGPVTHECPAQPGLLHVIESGYLAEIIDPVTLQPQKPGEPGELVLTTLTRTASPLLRYRTGDLVKASEPSDDPCACGRHTLAFEGGILGRIDDMVVIRGVNVYPGAIEEAIRGFSEVTEYQALVITKNSLAELTVKIEVSNGGGEDVANRLQRLFMNQLALRIPVEVAPPGSLPRFEMKAKRWIKEMNV